MYNEDGDNMKKILFIAVDDELLYEDEKIDDESVEEIKKLTEESNYVILTSGRTPDELVSISKMIGAKPYVVANNGAVIYDFVNYETILEARLNPHHLLEIMQTNKDDDIRIYITVRGKNITDDPRLDGTRFINVVPDLIESIKELSRRAVSINQITFESKDINKLIKLKHLLENKYPDLYVSTASREVLTEDTNDIKDKRYFMNFTLKNFDKKRAVEYLENRLGVSHENTIGIGDGHNDITLFEAVGYKIATNNAIPKLKEDAHFITENNQSAGAIKEVIKHILEKEKE